MKGIKRRWYKLSFLLKHTWLESFRQCPVHLRKNKYSPKKLNGKKYNKEEVKRKIAKA